MSNKLNLTDEEVRERIMQDYKRACVIDSNCEFDCKPGCRIVGECPHVERIRQRTEQILQGMPLN